MLETSPKAPTESKPALPLTSPKAAFEIKVSEGSESDSIF